MGCGYQGYEFGARYLDSICTDGHLQDADSDTDSLFFYGDIPCPKCRQIDAMDRYAEDNLDSPDCRWPRYYAWYLVMDIRRNRGLRSISFARYCAHRIFEEFVGDKIPGTSIRRRSPSFTSRTYLMQRWFW
jgi:hypothetical protein